MKARLAKEVRLCKEFKASDLSLKTHLFTKYNNESTLLI